MEYGLQIVDGGLQGIFNFAFLLLNCSSYFNNTIFFVSTSSPEINL